MSRSAWDVQKTLERKRHDFINHHGVDATGIVLFVQDYHTVQEHLSGSHSHAASIENNVPVWNGLPIYTVPFDIEPGILI